MYSYWWVISQSFIFFDDILKVISDTEDDQSGNSNLLFHVRANIS